MIEAASRAGIKHERFWTMTLREIATEVRAAGDVAAERLKLAQLTGWFSEVYARHKKLPDADKIWRPDRELSAEQREARHVEKLKQLALHTGGQVMEIKH